MIFVRSLVPVSCLLFCFFLHGCTENVKQPAVAGSFYPADATLLHDSVSDFIAKAEDKPVEGKLIALISPHAGHQFSGQVAAFSYKHLKEREVNTVILIGPAHYKAFKGVAVYAKGAMRTPLGDVPIDEKIAQSLINPKADVSFDPEAFAKEHSLEVQLPFLQETLKGFRVVPLLIGSPTRESFDHVTKKLIEVLRTNEKAIIITSTDLSHYHDYDTAVAKDKKTIDTIVRMSIEDLERYLRTGECEMCGGFPVIFTLAVAKGLGATNGVLYRYANSGDVTGSRDSVVGYAAIGLYRSPLTQEEKEYLLALAKNTIINYVTRGEITQSTTQNPKLSAMGATFVTINKFGNLRGCIGNIQPVMPLYTSVITNAVSASSNDHRFPPMTKDELSSMEVEVSVLSPLEPLYDVRDVEIGKHGLYLVKGQHTSVFLPQVPVEFGWDLTTYLENLSRKAGLPKEGWQDALLFTFTAEIIK